MIQERALMGPLHPSREGSITRSLTHFFGSVDPGSSFLMRAQVNFPGFGTDSSHDLNPESNLIIREYNFTFVKSLVLVQNLKPYLFNKGIGAVFSFKWTEFYNLYHENDFTNVKLCAPTIKVTR
jgi:hypothetical protein